MDNIENLTKEIKRREEELAALKEKLTAEQKKVNSSPETQWKWHLPEQDYVRYSRQMIVPNFGLQGMYIQGIKNAY